MAERQICNRCATVAVQGVLDACSAAGVSLRVGGGRLLASPASNVTPELAEAIKGNKAALMALLAPKGRQGALGAATPALALRLGHPAFDLAEAACACGNPPWVFTEAGEAMCKIHASRFPWPGWEAEWK